MSSSYRMELDKWLAQLNVKATSVLDMGGSQLPVKGRTKTWEVNNYLITDIAIPHANSPSPDAIFDLNFNQWQPEMSQYDLIFCLEVFDYIYDPMNAIKAIYDFLSVGGRAWVTFPTFYPTHNPIEDDALLYKEYGIRKLAGAVGLEILDMIKRRPETDAIEQLWRRERMRAAKGYDHDFTGFIVEFQK